MRTVCKRGRNCFTWTMRLLASGACLRLAPIGHEQMFGLVVSWHTHSRPWRLATFHCMTRSHRTCLATGLQSRHGNTVSSCIQHDVSQKTQHQAAVGFEATTASPPANTADTGERQRSDRHVVKIQGPISPPLFEPDSQSA